MANAGYLVDAPIDSVAVRLVLAAVVAIPVCRLLLRMGIRQPRVRVLVALIPTLTMGIVLALSWSNPRLPSVWSRFEGDGLSVPFGNTYVEFAPNAVEVLLGVWAVVAASRIGLRLARRRRVRRQVAIQVANAPLVPLRVALATDRIAESLDMPMPPVTVVDDCPGGACVHGIRRPRLLLDRRLVARLDQQELEGVLAHELAHIRRRDNLTSLLVSMMRDVFFFVPGSAWASRQLHAERELAADQVACNGTGRPGALASGLLKVLDLQGDQPALAASCLMPEMPESTIVGRVKLLVNPQELSSTRRHAEVGVVTAAVVAATSVGVGVPAWMVHGEGILGWSVVVGQVAETPTGPTVELAAHATAFDVFRSAPEGLVSTTVLDERVVVDDDVSAFSGAMQEACRLGASSCTVNTPRPSLGLRARTTTQLPAELVNQPRMTPIITTDVFRLFVNRTPEPADAS